MLNYLIIDLLFYNHLVESQHSCKNKYCTIYDYVRVSFVFSLKNMPSVPMQIWFVAVILPGQFRRRVANEIHEVETYLINIEPEVWGIGQGVGGRSLPI